MLFEVFVTNDNSRCQHIARVEELSAIKKCSSNKYDSAQISKHFVYTLQDYSLNRTLKTVAERMHYFKIVGLIAVTTLVKR